MSANLGATTFTSVVWTAGDTITEAKLDNMTANAQAYDSHSSNGYLADNHIHFAGKDTGGTAYGIARISSGDEIEIGDSGFASHIKMLQGVYQAPQTYSPSASGTATLDLHDGNEHRITMPAGNITIAVNNEVNGQRFIVSILQDGTGNRTVTWFNTIKWTDGVTPTLTTTGNKRDVFGFIVTGTDTYDGFIIGQNI